MISSEGGTNSQKPLLNAKLDRIISVATLLAALTAIVLVLKRPAPTPVTAPQQPAALAQSTQSADRSAATPTQDEHPFSSPIYESAPSAPATATAQATAAPAASDAKPTAGINSDQVSSAIAKMLGAGTSNLSPEANVGSGEPVIKDQQVTMDGDIVHGKFLTDIAGKDVWVTISGHMGEKDGYATFDPTEFKVGDMNVPVSLVNPALQRKLAEERDRLKIPNGQ